MMTSLPAPAAGFVAWRAAARSLSSTAPQLDLDIIGAGTLTGLDACLRVACATLGISLTVRTASYNQIEQTVFNGLPLVSTTDTNRRTIPRIVMLAWDTEWLVGQDLRHPYRDGIEAASARLADRERHVHTLLDAVLATPDVVVLTWEFLPPTATPLGIQESRRGGFISGLQAVNQRLQERAAHEPRLWTVPIPTIAGRFGLDRWCDHALRLHGDIRIRPDALPWVAEAIAPYCAARCGRQRKCLVLDADETLWGGVLGEDGITGIVLGDDGVGRAFREFQQVILGLHARGVLIALCSRNDPSDVDKVLRDHPGMHLRPEHIAARAISWQDKSMGLKHIANELNIGLDSLVFLDDDPANRLQVRASLPMVLVPDLPQNPADYADFLMQASWFPLWQLTAEDLSKGIQTAQREEREALRNQTADLPTYLAELCTVITCGEMTAATRPRISQLCLKTNQFNTTLQRLDEAGLQALQDQGRLVRTVDVRDRFGGHGLTGLAVVERGQKTWRIEILLLSCRILGRMIEHALLFQVAEEAIAAGAHELAVPYVRGERNQPAQDFLTSLPGSMMHNEAEVRLPLPLSSIPSLPSHLRLEFA